MRTFYDVLQLLKRFGIFIYTRDRSSDLQLIEKEMNELHTWGMVDTETFQSAILIIRRELAQLSDKEKKE
ncbi:YqgQ family protein [Alkalihalobacillus trypoxylicola]|uniref:Cytosolic protein n=1 Tax=Alkalihalobacillus trypoxylicola TaxID=519424 RepID=A0A162E989_9BACI|nr:YqgQ family protein [Alkalihalobacillus trypoxylicola]KYG32089.1 hypothetical protein AZF04_04775 [Alkalihalobacillus trypoxylicola]